jgi:CSLREA domain-containing protein
MFRSVRRASARAVTRLSTVALGVSVVVTGVAAVAPTAGAAPAVTFTVNSTADAPDSGKNGQCKTATNVCTLRAALMEANWATQAVTVNFNIAGSGTKTIQIGSRLPTLTIKSGVTINGYSQPGSSVNTSTVVSNAQIKIEIRGNGPTSFDGLVFQGTSNNVVRGISIYNFINQIMVTGLTADNNRIVGNIVCTNAAATVQSAVSGKQIGIVLQKGASGNKVGTPAPADRNVVSGCGNRGIVLSFQPTVNNTIQNNIVGLTPNGAAARPNRSNAVDINYTDHNLVGGDGPGMANIISGNGGSAVEDSHGKGNHDNQIVGNLLGTTPTGAAASYAANALWGIRFEGPYFCGKPGKPNPGGCTDAQVVEGVPHNNYARANVIVSNRSGGIMIDKGHNRVSITGNWIGVTKSGSNAGNSIGGIMLQRGPWNQTISGNIIANSPTAIQISSVGGDPSGNEQTTYGNLISRNSMFNTNGIIFNYVSSASMVQHGMKPPTLVAGSGKKVTGKTCAGCTVELFVAAGSGVKAGRTYLATVTANSAGAFSATLSGASSGSPITATATNKTRDTSQFQTPVTLKS